LTESGRTASDRVLVLARRPLVREQAIGVDAAQLPLDELVGLPVLDTLGGQAAPFRARRVEPARVAPPEEPIPQRPQHEASVLTSHPDAKTIAAVAPDAEITVVRRPDERRYELIVEGKSAGELVYRDRGGGVLALLHTEVDPTLQRRGLGSALVAGALDDARVRGLRVVPICPFVEAFVRDRPEYADLVVDDPARRA